MHNLIKYISDILNIKTESVYTIQDMTEELSKIRDIVAYRSYIKDHMKSIDFVNGYQKFLLLTQQYLRLEYTALNPTVKATANKISKIAYSAIMNGKYTEWSYPDLGQIEEQYKGILPSIGSAMEIQKLLDNDKLEEAIIKKIMEKENALPYEQLPERMSAMLTNTTKAIK